MNAAQIMMSKPAVHVLCGLDAPEYAFRQLLYGLEEEGIPCELQMGADGDAVAMAWEGAQASRLGVGVGLDGRDAVLQMSRLDCETPLFRVSVHSAERVRILGANAARLVKKLPLKPLEGRWEQE